MKIYLAAVYTTGISLHGTQMRRATDVERRAREAIPHILESYHYVEKRSFVEAMRRDNTKVFLDSGAFSAFSKGAKVDLPRYCDYIHANKDIVEVASVLDGIGDPELTWQNQWQMEQRGTNPLPCFHYGEDTAYLDHYVANYDYITLGGMVPVSTQQLYHWLDRMWAEHLTDEHGKPLVKVHGFGLTSIPLMAKYPWYSVDSSSWVQISSNGSIILDGGRTLSVSSNAPSIKMKGQHFQTLTEQEQQVVRNEVESRGFDIEKLATSYSHRWFFCIDTFNRMNETYGDKEPVYAQAQPLLF